MLALILNARGFWWTFNIYFRHWLDKLLDFFRANYVKVVILNQNLVSILLIAATHAKTELVVLY